MALLQIEHLNFTYPDGTTALTDVSLTLPEGSITLLCGASGSGKTTLLRLLKTPIAPTGQVTGHILYDGQPYPLAERVDAQEIGYVGQDPDAQIVTDRVWQELAFGLENLGIDSSAIRRRVGETASYFGMESWYDRPTDELSGGQKQQLNLAAALTMRPRLLLLDEPTSQLDPIAATAFLATLRRLNEELGLTILLVEHRLEETLALAEYVLLLDGGKVTFAGSPREACARLRVHSLAAALPTAARAWYALGGEGDCPLTVREGRRFLAALPAPSAPRVPAAPMDEPALVCRDVWYRYDKTAPDVLHGFSLTVGKGEIYSLLGGNGAGKTTALYAMAGLTRPYKGSIKYNARVAFLPQDPRHLFSHETVREELAQLASGGEAIATEWEIAHLLDRHPYDLSGGEQQRVALAKLLTAKPEILLLDEPTKGLDAENKQRLADRLRDLSAQGVTVLLVTHDTDFAAQMSSRCGLLFDGQLVSEDVPQRFFGDNVYYTTDAGRLSRGMVDGAVTCRQVIESWGG